MFERRSFAETARVGSQVDAVIGPVVHGDERQLCAVLDDDFDILRQRAASQILDDDGGLRAGSGAYDGMAAREPRSTPIGHDDGIL